MHIPQVVTRPHAARLLVEGGAALAYVWWESLLDDASDLTLGWWKQPFRFTAPGDGLTCHSRTLVKVHLDRSGKVGAKERVEGKEWG